MTCGSKRLIYEPNGQYKTEPEEVLCSRPYNHLPATRHAGVTREMVVVQWDGGPSGDIMASEPEGVTPDAPNPPGTSTPAG